MDDDNTKSFFNLQDNDKDSEIQPVEDEQEEYVIESKKKHVVE